VWGQTSRFLPFFFIFIGSLGPRSVLIRILIASVDRRNLADINVTDALAVIISRSR
jgi:hypothetical protein